MKKQYKLIMITALSLLLAGCAPVAAPVNGEVKDVPAEAKQEVEKPTEETVSSIDTEPAADEATETEPDTEDTAAEKMGPEEGLYDRTYLEEKDGGYVYKMSDPDIIKKYDELYAAAFADVVASYKEAVEWQNQSFDFNKPLTITDLVQGGDSKNYFLKTGSYYEMDYGFDLNNVGYTYVDLDSDGTFELIFGVLSDADTDWVPEDFFERAYGLVDGKPVKFCEGGSRDEHWLGSDGCIYETGSGGAAYSGTWRLHFDPSLLKAGENVDWGSNGFVEDEFVGYWEVPVHIKEDVADIDEQALKPENRISEDELAGLEEEWSSRKVRIDWLRMEYLL